MKPKPLTILAAVAAAFSLAACDQNRPGNSTTSRSSDSMSSSAAATDSSPKMDVSQKLASAADKVTRTVDDAALTAQVKTALMTEPGLRSLQIDVDTKDAMVTLSGSVDSAANKTRAKEIAASVGGVSGVIDHLTVKSS